MLLAVVFAFGLSVVSEARAAAPVDFYYPQGYAAGPYFSTREAACEYLTGRLAPPLAWSYKADWGYCVQRDSSGQYVNSANVYGTPRCAPNGTAPDTSKPLAQQCGDPAPNCSDASLASKYIGAWVVGSGVAPDYACIQGCQYPQGSTAVGLQSSYGMSIGKGNGKTCSGANYDSIDTTTKPTDPPSPVSCGKMGLVYGTVNGVGICAKGGEIPGTTVTKNDTKTSTATDASGVQAPSQTTNTTTNVTNINGVPTVTRTTTNPDGTKTSATESKDAFCAKNADDSVCKDTDSFQGSCAASFTCTGDAIQCAIAKEQYTRNCQAEASHPYRDAFSAEEGKPQGNAGVIAATGGLQVVDVQNKLDNVTDRFGTGACPAPLVMRPMDVTVEISFQPVCEYAGWIRAIVLLCTALFCARILFFNKD